MEKVKFSGFWRRAGAAILDSIVLLIALFAIEILVLDKIGLSLRGFSTPLDMNPFEILKKESGGMVINFSLGVLYFVVLTAQFGATLGKMALKIKVVRKDFSPVGYKEAIIREFLVKGVLYSVLLISVIGWIPLLLAYLWMIWDPKKQTWHDKIAKTCVIKED